MSISSSIPSATRPRVIRVRRSRRLGVLVAVALAGTTLSAGCSAIARPGSVAVVNGVAIKDDEVDATTQQINDSKILQQALTTKQVGLYLFLSKFVLPEVAKTNSWTPDAQFATAMSKIPNPTQATTDVLKTYVITQSGALTDQQIAGIFAAIKGSDVQLDPRYGSIDQATGQLKDVSTPDWIVPTPTTAAGDAGAAPTAPATAGN